jgi:hypothetical protein
MATGSNTIGAAAAQVVSTTPTVCSAGVQLKADDDNTGSIYVGYSSAVTAGTTPATDGVRLKAGQSYFVPAAKLRSLGSTVADASNVWAIASASGQKIYFDTI